MLNRAVATFQRWQYRGGRPQWWTRIENRMSAIAFRVGHHAHTDGHARDHRTKIGAAHHVPVVVADYEGDRYLVGMLGHTTNWVRNVRAADGRAVLRHGRREPVDLVEDSSDRRAAILRSYLEVAPGARPFIPVDRRAPLTEFERIVDDYPVFRIA
jgi:hypothetical protein